MIEIQLEQINKSYLENPQYQDKDDYPNLVDTLERYQKQFMEYDLDHSGDIDIMELKAMMERLSQAKTNLELKKMIAEVDRENRGSISYNDFLFMMLGKKSSVLKLILKFEEAMQ